MSDAAQTGGGGGKPPQLPPKGGSGSGSGSTSTVGGGSSIGGAVPKAPLVPPLEKSPSMLGGGSLTVGGHGVEETPLESASPLAGGSSTTRGGLHRTGSTVKVEPHEAHEVTQRTGSVIEPHPGIGITTGAHTGAVKTGSIPPLERGHGGSSTSTAGGGSTSTAGGAGLPGVGIKTGADTGGVKTSGVPGQARIEYGNNWWHRGDYYDSGRDQYGYGLADYSQKSAQPAQVYLPSAGYDYNDYLLYSIGAISVVILALVLALVCCACGACLGYAVGQKAFGDRNRAARRKFYHQIERDDNRIDDDDIANNDIEV